MLEEWVKTKTAPDPLKFDQSLKEKWTIARLQLASALEHDRLPDFQRYYNLTEEELMMIGMHVHLATEMQEDVHWDLVYQIMFPEP